ncbi:MAG TPA: lasso peptide biosynthesis B2 protein [Gemmatimonadota bacterium]|nr:lasso peptide biosynthesis B2 protein [Gemmatimonadota bacterium]
MTRRFHRIRGFLDLPPRRRRLFLQAWTLFPLLAAALRAFGFRRVCGLLMRGPAGAPPDPEGVADAVAAVELAAIHSPVDANCLLRSLALVRILRGLGADPRLRFGVCQRDDRFEAHAWVELGGEVLNDAPDVGIRYRPFDTPITVPTHVWR